MSDDMTCIWCKGTGIRRCNDGMGHIDEMECGCGVVADTGGEMMGKVIAGKVEVEAVSQWGFTCPCGAYKFRRVDHLEGRGIAGPWFCDECSVGWWVRWDATSRTITIEDKGDRSTVGRSLLRLRPGVLHLEVGTTGAHDGQRYYHEEHTCPINQLWHSTRVWVDGDEDRHGAFDYLGTMTSDEDHDWGAIVPDLQTEADGDGV